LWKFGNLIKLKIGTFVEVKKSGKMRKRRVEDKKREGTNFLKGAEILWEMGKNRLGKFEYGKDCSPLEWFGNSGRCLDHGMYGFCILSGGEKKQKLNFEN
jgi:hypothetical protein